jgi:hypothetical protein
MSSSGLVHSPLEPRAVVTAARVCLAYGVSSVKQMVGPEQQHHYWAIFTSRSFLSLSSKERGSEEEEERNRGE